MRDYTTYVETICDAKANWASRICWPFWQFYPIPNLTTQEYPPPRKFNLGRSWHFEFWLPKKGLQLEYVETNRCISAGPARAPLGSISPEKWTGCNTPETHGGHAPGCGEVCREDLSPWYTPRILSRSLVVTLVNYFSFCLLWLETKNLIGHYRLNSRTSHVALNI